MTPVTVTEDEIGSFFVLENDLDADNDPIHNLSTSAQAPS
jgi:hypothetical protein